MQMFNLALNVLTRSIEEIQNLLTDLSTHLKKSKVVLRKKQQMFELFNLVHICSLTTGQNIL